MVMLCMLIFISWKMAHFINKLVICNRWLLALHDSRDIVGTYLCKSFCANNENEKINAHLFNFIWTIESENVLK